ncbi:hypothetical protein ABT381_03855 [Streptomyces sp. NPDC000151]|uniref:hypothetical protein n=1 Tax=Streptomyces sp. NPDC000151 TaxID=3154244 RepID=UPI00332AB784
MRQSVGIALPLAALACALALLTACGGSTGNTHPCTLRGTLAGIQVKVPPELANRTADATLTACWDGTCRKRTLWLRGTRPEEPATPGNPVMTTETATATATATGAASQPPEPHTWPGFAAIRDLPTQPVHITLVFKNQRGATVLDRQITTTPQPTYPNGRDCAPGNHQAHLTVTKEGSLIPR